MQKRTQLKTKVHGEEHWTSRKFSGQLMDQMKSVSAKPFKGVRKEKSNSPPLSAQPSLFPSPRSEPAGLRYQPDFVTPAEEEALVARIRALPLAPFQFGAYEGKRRVAYFGSRYDFTHQRLEKADEIPPWLAPVVAAVENFAGVDAGSIRHALVTEYETGAGIGWHRDKKHFAEIFGLSLGSPCKFRFRRDQGGKWQRFTLDAQPRSLYAMTGEARHIWEHSIPPVETPRYSITFRTMLG